ncbi:coproporphyrinogen III oxidase, oxygen-independent HemN [Psychroflexus torquis ATCC 700755]|uniref:Coproporphyrinogen-III oxidase n=1 Tax=Psychroflexus torquis (strain ATCC 700755 / CIP 106069 / ACAM 623) TaxID=313595 RepID=K4II65_PSYTT|nr:oxygen-independent coproporphyrinogen III oxidase [Psychroflexus torquis]AFU69488.1 coproporphyrinogen III oxidase, oxygen-independent HemN [Psychroflexus torquis ATCC 700755]
MTTKNRLVSKYNVPGPRYTSYPTVPYWDESSFTVDKWKGSLQRGLGVTPKAKHISLYIHLPFCESMCTFCGCTKRITKNHTLELPYIKALLKELSMYSEVLGDGLVIQQLHLGGGTPTFFSVENLEELLMGIFKIADKTADCEFSFEGHPNNTTKEHLEMFNHNGFTRVCYGVQDYNETVQKAINRIQPFEHVEQATKTAREAGFSSVGHDIIFGLPFQTQEHVLHTIKQTIALMPDRIAFYSYAHVPWIKGNGQRGYSEENLPTPEQKRLQYETGKKGLLEAGYVEIGMDHFALKTDELYKAQQKGQIHRNFMGYSSSKTDVMIGLGVSAIGDSWYGFAQNVKTLKDYYELVRKGTLPLLRGHLLTEEDLIIRKHILNLMCSFKTSWEEEHLQIPQMEDIVFKLSEMEADGLVDIAEDSIAVTEAGKPFVRNVCLPFDLRLQRKKPKTKLFSMTV